MQRNLIQVADDTDLYVLKVLKYYSIFNYPLKLEEIHSYCAKPCSLGKLTNAIHYMLAEGSIYQYKCYYSLSSTIESQVHRREAGNKLAASQINAARRAGSLIYKFPFVRFVGISGSLSKGFASPGSDFDYFIVTTYNRLWICRSLLHVFKKLTFLYGGQHKFCMNYFIDASALALADQNIFTAIELASMIPVKGESTYKKLIQANQWLYDYLPNKTIDHNHTIIKKDTILKRSLEKLLEVLWPNKLNNALMKLTDSKWRKKWARKNYPAQDYAQAFKTTLHISKNHPANYQKRVLSLLEKMDDINS